MELIKRFSSLKLQIVGGVIIFGYLLFAVMELIGGYESARKGTLPLFTDFTPKYAASLLVHSEPAANLYIPERMYQASMAAAQAAYGGTLNERQARSVGFSAWMYPPFFILAIFPLALLPYLASLICWLAVTSIPYLLAISRAIQGRGAWLIAFASPPAFYNLMFGQTGFLSGGLIGLGLSQVYLRPVISGVCIGLASLKPHLGILIPFALIAGEHWKSFGIATITVVCLVVVSVLAFGMDPWYGLIGTIEFYQQGFEAKAYSYYDMITVHGMFHLAGAGNEMSGKAQAVSAIGAIATVIWAWRHRGSSLSHLGLQIAVLCSATLLAVPMAYSYDAALLVPGAAWIWADMKERGASVTEISILMGTMAAILPLKPVASISGFQYGPLICLSLTTLAAYRLHSLRRQDGNNDNG